MGITIDVYGAHKMDYELDIAFPREYLDKARLKEVIREWGGVKYRQKPAEYVTGSGIKFIESGYIDYFRHQMGDTPTDSFVFLSLDNRHDDNSLYELEYLINRAPEKLNENMLLSFIKNLAVLPTFYLMLARDDERVKDIYETYTREDIFQAVTNCLDWDKPGDIMIYKKTV